MENPLILLFDLSLLIVVILISGNFVRLLHLPKVTGYLLAGIIIGRYVLGNFIPEIYDYLFPEELKPILNLIQRLAIGMIIFTIGGNFISETFRRLGKKILIISLFEIILSFSLIALCTFPFMQESFYAIPLAIIGISTAPAATLMVLREYESEGDVSRHLIVLIGINTFATITLFKLTVSIFELGEQGFSFLIIGQALIEIFGSVALGLILGFILSFIERLLKSNSEFLMLYTGAILALIGMTEIIKDSLGVDFSDLIAILSMGIVIANTSVKENKAFEVLKGVDLPIYALFFVLSGMKLKVYELANFDYLFLIIAYIIGRTLGKFFGGYLGALVIGKRKNLHYYVGVGLLTQEGLAIGLNTILMEHYPNVASQISTIIIASVVIFALFGPIFTRLSIVKAGEVKALSLKKKDKSDKPYKYHHPFALIRKTLGMDIKKVEEKHEREIKAKEVMRQAVEKLQETMPFDDIIDFASQSKYDVFPVVDEENRLLGIVSYSSIRDVIVAPEFAHAIIAGDLMDTTPMISYPEETLHELLEKFKSSQEDLDYLPVVETEENRKLIGIITQADVLLALRRSQTKQSKTE